MFTTPTPQYQNEQNVLRSHAKFHQHRQLNFMKFPPLGSLPPGSLYPKSIYTTFKRKNLQRNKNNSRLWSHQKSSFWNYASFYFARKRHRFRSSNVLTVLNRLGIAVNKVTYWSASKCSSIPTAANSDLHFCLFSLVRTVDDTIHGDSLIHHPQEDCCLMICCW